MSSTDDTPGKVMTYAEYAKIPAVNWSTLKHMRDSPAHYLAARRRPVQPDTDALTLGRVTHMALFEPHLLETVAIWTGGARRGKAWDAWRDEHAGQDIIRERDLEPIRAMAEAVRAHPIAGPLLAGGGRGEQTLTWTDTRSKIACKARLDWLSDAGDLVDLKTAADLDPRSFARAVHRYGYHGQLAHYRAACLHSGMTVHRALIIGVEKRAPWDVMVYQLDRGAPEGALYVGEQVRRELLDRLAECIETDSWPGRGGDSIQPLLLPPYALPDVGESLTF